MGLAGSNLVAVKKSVTNAKGTTFTRTYWVNPEKLSVKIRKMPVPKLKLPSQKSKGLGKQERAGSSGEWLSNERVTKGFSEIGHAFAEQINPNSPLGVEKVRAGSAFDKVMLGANAACFSVTDKSITMTEAVASELRSAIDGGATSTFEQMSAMRVMGHEMAHSASSGLGDMYEPFSTEFAPHRALEEATTEVLGQHFAGEVAEALGAPFATVLSENFAPDLLPLFRPRQSEKGGTSQSPVDDVGMSRPVAYHDWVRQFGRAAVYVADAQGARSEDLTHAVVSVAADLKKLHMAQRYRRMAEIVTQRHLVETEIMYDHAPEYGAAKKSIGDVLQRFIHGSKEDTYAATTEDLDRNVKAIVVAAIQGHKERTDVVEKLWAWGKTHEHAAELSKEIQAGKIPISEGHVRLKGLKEQFPNETHEVVRE